MKVTFEFEIEGLPAYDSVAGRQNLFEFLNKRILCGTLEEHMGFLATVPDMNTPMNKALAAAYNEDEELARRMMEGLKIEL